MSKDPQDVVTLVFRSEGGATITPHSEEIIAAARMALADPNTYELAGLLADLALMVRKVEDMIEDVAEIGRRVGRQHLQLVDQHGAGIADSCQPDAARPDQPRTAVGSADPVTCRHTSPERHPIDADLWWCPQCSTVLYPIASTSDTEAHEDVPDDVAP